MDEIEIYLCYPPEHPRDNVRINSWPILPMQGERIVAPDYGDYRVRQVVHDFSGEPHQMRIYLEVAHATQKEG